MTGIVGYSVYTLSIAAGGRERLGWPGDYVRCLALSGATAIRIAFDGAPDQYMALGLAYRSPEPWREVELVNPGAGAVTIQVGIGLGEIRDDRLIYSAPIEIAKATVIRSTADVAIAAGAVVQVLAAAATRRRAIVGALTTNARELRVGDSLVTATRGLELDPGDRIELEIATAVYVANPHSGAQTVSLLELMD